MTDARLVSRGRSIRAGVPLAAGLTMLAATACDGHLVGTRDVDLEYRLAESAPSGTDLKSLAAARLEAAGLTAELRSSGDGLQVVSDEGAAEGIDEVLTWPGGLTLDVIDSTGDLEPRPIGGAAPPPWRVATETSASGATERYFVGASPAIARAARTTPPSGGRRLVCDATGAVARTRVVFDPPLADLTGRIRAAEARGATLELDLEPAAVDAATHAAETRGGRAVAFVRDASILATAPITISGATLSIPLGSSPSSYARAELAARLLRTPGLPRLARVSVTRKPASYALGVAGLVVPLAMSLAWLAFVRRFDRARPEPRWLVLLTFALGGAAVVPASFLEWTLGRLSPYLNPELMTFGGQLWALPAALVASTLTVGVVEEAAKLAAAWLVARQRREFDEPVDGIVYAAAAALGFAALENVRYLAAGRLAPSVVVTRAFMSAPAHLLFSALWGYALGRRLVEPRRRVWPAFAMAALAHGTFDACLSFTATAPLAPILNFGLASAFVVLLRKALRHGPIGDGPPSSERGARLVFPVGSRALFACSVLAMHASAALVFALGVRVEQSHARVGSTFLVASTALLAALAATAYGVSATLPLDAVVDDAGVTFAGAFLAWSRIASIHRRAARRRARQRVVVEGDGVGLSIGPIDAAGAVALEEAMRARWSAARRAPTPGGPTSAS